ncbi:MAG: HAD-IIB family hydrolase [Nitrospirae bacterium]|nr:MAG: HAD-IIB family hydrolase [Nitrospirota bacterium]
MYRRVMAFDFDGTLALDGAVSSELESALEQCRASGHALFLVTGRRFETVSLGHMGELFTGVVWENGAVLAHTASGEIYLPFGQIGAHLLKALEETGIPFERGLAIAATWVPHDQVVWRVLGTQPYSGGAAVEYNKGAVMIVPPGAAKGAGLQRLLTICGFSARNLAAFGDAENDLSMLTLAEVGVAVGDAVPAIRDLADVVAVEPGPAGVLEVLQRYPLAGRFLDIPLRRERPILIGQDDRGQNVSLPASRLAGRNLGVFGDSGTGKSWMVGLLAEGLHHEDYQVLLVDPEGNFRGLRVLPRFVALEGDRSSMPTPTAVVSLLDAAGVSAVVDLSRYPLALRSGYVAELIRVLRPLRERKYRPHWIVLEEAQQFLLPGGEEVTAAVVPQLEVGGWALVSYRPDRMDRRVLQAMHHCLLTRTTEPEATRAVLDHCEACHKGEIGIGEIPTGSALLCGGPVVRLRPAIRRVPHVRHLYKYLDVPLPPDKRFWFRDEQAGIGREAASLYEFLQLIPVLPIQSLEYHDRRQDFSHWAEKVLGDEGLAMRLRKLSNRLLKGEEFREALRQTVAAHYEELNALR